MNYFRCGGGRSTHTATKITVAKTPLATFESNVSGLYIPEILAYFSATQSGTGDPSPSNPRTINGVSSVSVGIVNNTANAEYFEGLLKGTHCAIELSFYNWTENATYDNVFNTPIISITYTTADRTSIISDMYPVYSSSDVMDYDYGIAIAASRRQFYVKNKDYSTAADFKTAMAGHYIIFKLATPITPTITKAEYEAVCAAFGYTGTTATTALGGTYYGGYLNVPTGVLTVTHANIASYNGESINEPWLCSEAVYSEGATPPTGSQVVYPLATPQTYQLTPAQIEQLLGQNNVFCSTGDVAVKYWKID